MKSGAAQITSTTLNMIVAILKKPHSSSVPWRRGGLPTHGGRVTSTLPFGRHAAGSSGHRDRPETDLAPGLNRKMMLTTWSVGKRLKVCKAFIRELRLQLARTDKGSQEECDWDLGLIGENTLGAHRSASPLRNFSCAPLLTANRGASIWFATLCAGRLGPQWDLR